MAIPPINPPLNNYNNPTKEILAASGIYSGISYAATPYANDINNSTSPNTGRVSTTPPAATTTAHPSGHSLFAADIRSGSAYIDDMLIFNDYIHHHAVFGSVLRFNVESFLQQSIVNFNVYSLEYR